MDGFRLERVDAIDLERLDGIVRIRRQGGGFGSFSKACGTAAGSLLEAEIVTADGQTRIVNQAREPDLFWALKGGGTFGVVTRVTLATHVLPTTCGAVTLNLGALSGEAYRRLLARCDQPVQSALGRYRVRGPRQPAANNYDVPRPHTG